MYMIFTTDGVEVVRIIEKYIINNEEKYYVERYCGTDLIKESEIYPMEDVTCQERRNQTQKWERICLAIPINYPEKKLKITPQAREMLKELKNWEKMTSKQRTMIGRMDMTPDQLFHYLTKDLKL